MPYRVRNQGNNNWAIQKNENGKWKTVGKSKSKAMAEASIRARYANEKK